MLNWIKRRISRRIKELEAENENLRGQNEVYLRLKEIHMTDKKWNVDFQGEFIPILAEMLYTFFIEAGGVNYVEMRLSPKTEGIGPMLLTLQRVWGKTAHELRKEAESQVEILQQKLLEISENQVKN